MAPQRIKRAVHAMKDLGIAEETVKPVLKDLLKLYERNWELIEEENYRTLADAIFEYLETKAFEEKNVSKNSVQDEDLEEEDQERPLKRRRIGQVSSSLNQSVDMMESLQPNDGNIELPLVLAVQESFDPSQPSAANNTWPEPLCEGVSIRGDSCTSTDGLEPQPPECENKLENNEGVPTPASSSKERTSHKFTNIQEGSGTNLDIASSSTGEVKISISCDAALGRPDFHMPSLDAVLKMVEDRCLRSYRYRVIDPSFSLRKLMRDLCECVWELGTDLVDEPQEQPTVIAPVVDLLKKSLAWDALGGRYNIENFVMPCTAEAAVPPIQGLPQSLNGNNDHSEINKTILENGCDKGEKEGEHEGVVASSCSLVVAHQRQLTPHDIRLLHDFNDITRGEETVKIPWVNEINNEHPSPFHYVPHNLVFKNAYVNLSLAHIGDDDCCSNCFGNCLSSSEPCVCTHEFGGEFACTLEGLLKEVFLEERKGHLAVKIIRECWSKCGCHRQCGNRLVQRGITCNLQVFLTPEGKGWGLRLLEDLPKGAFVCEYVGEILTHTELRERKKTDSGGKHAYVVLLDADWGPAGSRAKEALYLDARCYGNVARFINHRCSDANLIQIPVQVEAPDHHYYRIAFFTSRKVDALEELTWDYGIEFDDQNHSIKAFRCKCGSTTCRDGKLMNRSRSAAILR